MKKVSLKVTKNILNRDEMRVITGGGKVIAPGCYDCGNGCEYMCCIGVCQNGTAPKPCGHSGNCDI
jgi:hypothetical protein